MSTLKSKSSAGSDEAIRLADVIADHIENGTPLEGIFSRSKLAEFVRETASAAKEFGALTIAHPLEQWSESDGPVLWWAFPVTEPPFSGTPLDSDWPGHQTHWTRIPTPSI